MISIKVHFTERNQCAANYTYYRGYCYSYINSQDSAVELGTSQNARGACAKDSSHLLWIQDEEEAYFIKVVISFL